MGCQWHGRLIPRHYRNIKNKSIVRFASGGGTSARGMGKKKYKHTYKFEIEGKRGNKCARNGEKEIQTHIQVRNRGEARIVEKKRGYGIKEVRSTGG